MRIGRYLVLAACFLGVATVQAATIGWPGTIPYTTSGDDGSCHGTDLDTGIFVTNGTQMMAQNVGGPSLTFDGISFDAGTILFPGDHAGTYDGFHEGGGPSQTATYGDDHVGGPDTVTLSGLTAGHTYRIQLLFFDGRTIYSSVPGRTIAVDGVNLGTYANGTGTQGEEDHDWGDGLLVTGYFTADGATQDFTPETFNDGTSYAGHLNALVVHDISLPCGTVVLIR